MRQFYQLLVNWGSGEGYGVWDLGLIEEDQVQKVVDEVIVQNQHLKDAEQITVVIAKMKRENDGSLRPYPV